MTDEPDAKPPSSSATVPLQVPLGHSIGSVASSVALPEGRATTFVGPSGGSAAPRGVANAGTLWPKTGRSSWWGSLATDAAGLSPRRGAADDRSTSIWVERLRVPQSGVGGGVASQPDARLQLAGFAAAG